MHQIPTKKIKRTIETIEEEIPIEIPPSMPPPKSRRPDCITLLRWLMIVVSALIVLEKYWPQQKKITLQDKLIGESQLKLPALPPSQLRRQKEKAVSKKRKRVHKTYKRQRKKTRRKYRRRRYYERRYDPYFD